MSHNETFHSVYEALADEIDREVRLVAPDFPDWETARVLSVAADVALHDVDLSTDPIRYGDREQIASALNGCSEPQRSQLLERASDYAKRLRLARADDLSVARATPDLQPKRSYSSPVERRFG